MTEEQLRAFLKNGGNLPSEKWSNVARDLSTLEEIGHAGWVFLLKVDGLRTGNRFTVVLSRSTPNSDPFRRDGSELGPMLRDAIDFFLAG